MSKKKRAILEALRKYGPSYSLDLSKYTGQKWFIHSRLYELEQSGMIEGQWAYSDDLLHLGIHRRLLYRITDAGRRSLLLHESREKSRWWNNFGTGHV